MKRASPPLLSGLVSEATQVQPGVWLGTVFCEEGLTTAYIKVMSPQKMLVECLAAMLGRAHDLPIPRPHIVSVEDPSFLPECPLPGWTGWAFGSSASVAPTLERITRDEETAARLLKGWKRAVEGAVFDCLIANEDRTRKNILWSDGPEGVGLIDHDDALPGWVMHDPRTETRNLLLDILCDGDDDLNRLRLRKQSLEAAQVYSRTEWQSFIADPVWLKLFSDEPTALKLLDYVLTRLNHLPYLLERGTKSPQHQVPYVGGALANPLASA